jgi:hypothetical protein
MFHLLKLEIIALSKYLGGPGAADLKKVPSRAGGLAKENGTKITCPVNHTEAKDHKRGQIQVP